MVVGLQVAIAELLGRLGKVAQHKRVRPYLVLREYHADAH